MLIDELQTPALLCDRPRLTRNIDRAAARAAALGVALRPHVKTHKCVEIAALQRDRGARGLTVSTLTEAGVFAAAGFDDLTLAVPLPPTRVDPALDLAREAGVTLRLLVDDPGAFETLERAAASRGQPAHAWLKIDCGLHRAGLAPESPAALGLARRMARSHAVRFDGLLTHAGHAYAAFDDPPAQRLRIAEQERDAVVRLARRLRREGVEVPGVSVGSTPTFTAARDLSGVTEARPGNYVFFDLTQLALRACSAEDLALSLLATVVSHPDGADRCVVDAGALALSKDAGPPGRPSAWAAVCPDPSTMQIDPSLHLVSLTQEHGVIHPARPGDLQGRLPVGSRLRLLPNHACLAVACFDELNLVDGRTVVDRYRIQRRR